MKLDLSVIAILIFVILLILIFFYPHIIKYCFADQTVHNHLKDWQTGKSCNAYYIQDWNWGIENGQPVLYIQMNDFPMTDGNCQVFGTILAKITKLDIKIVVTNWGQKVANPKIITKKLALQLAEGY